MILRVGDGLRGGVRVVGGLGVFCFYIVLVVFSFFGLVSLF